jgi:hypothetical protein
MAEGADRAAWNRTAELWAVIANTFRAKGQAVSAKAIHPYYDAPAADHTGSGRLALTADNLDAFAQAFVRNHAKRK